MKSSKQLTKRAFSPIVHKNIQISDRKKKSTSTFHQISYKPKDFDPYGKSDKKRTSNYLKDILKQPDSVNKYRIVTEPVDDRVITIVSSSFVPSKSKPREPELPHPRARQASLPKAESSCTHCARYSEQIAFLQTEISKIINLKSQWKNGQINLEQLRDSWALGSSKLKAKQTTAKPIDSMLLDVKRNFCDLMRDIESLTEIDYPKMLAQKIFHYSPIPSSKNTQESQIKSLLGQLRQHYEGKVTGWDLEEQSEESDHVKAILRNLRARLSHYLRENLELKAKKAILEKADQITSESEDYLRQIIEDVLHSYASKI